MKAFILSITFILCLIVYKAGATDTPWIKLRIPGPYMLSAKEAKSVISIPFTLTNAVNRSSVSINTKEVYVRIGSSLDSLYKEGVAISIDKATNNINLSVNMKVLAKPGTYEVLIVFTADNQAPVEIPVSLTRPAAELTIDTPLKVIITNKLFGGIETDGNAFTVKETGGASGATLQLLQPLFSKFKSAGLMTFTNDKDMIDADGQKDITYTINSTIAAKLPIGEKFSGTFKIKAAESVNPASFTIEIVHVRSPVLIVIVIIFGVLLGFLMRTYIKNMTELDEKRIIAGDFLLLIKKDLAGIEDTKYKTEITTITNDLRNKLLEKISIFPKKESLATAIVALTETTTARYNEAKTKFKEQCDAAQKKVEKLGTILQSPTLPVAFRNYLLPADEEIKTAATKLFVFNPGGAEENISSAINMICDFLGSYQKAIDQFATQVENKLIVPDIAPAAFKDMIAQIGKEIKTKLAEVLPANKEVDVIIPALKTAIDVQGRTGTMLNLVIENITVLYTNDQTNDNSQSMKDLKNKFDGWKDAVNQQLSTPLTKFDPSVVTQLNQAWAIVTAAQQGGGGRLGGQKNANPAAFTKPEWFEQIFLPGSRNISREFNSDPLEMTIRQAKSHWLIWSIFRTLFMLILLCFAGYFFYKNDYTGTVQQLFMIFIAAFSMDITIANITTFPGKKLTP